MNAPRAEAEGRGAGGALAAVGALHGAAVFSRRVRVLSRAIASLLPAGRVVDVGCGSGSIAAAIAALRPDVAVEGFDVLVRPGTAIPVAPFDGRRLPLPDGAAAAAVLVDVLHHTDDPAALLAECARVAGVVVVKDHVSDSRADHAILSFMDWVGNRPHGVVLPYNYLGTGAWAHAHARAGLAETARADISDLYPFPFRLVFGGRLHFVARLAPREAAT